MVETSDYATIGALAATIVGLVFTALQIRRNAAATEREKEVESQKFYTELYKQFFLNDDWYYIFSLINNGEYIFPVAAPTTEEELKKQKAIERLFAHLETICSLYKKGLLVKSDMEEFDYNIQRIYNAPGFLDYQHNLDNWRKQQGLSRGPYSNFFWYTDTNKDRLHIQRE